MAESKPKSKEDAIVDAQQSFYRVLEALELRAMSDHWLHEDWVQCLHRGGLMVRGWEAIKNSWEDIFRSTLQLRIEPSDTWVVLRGNVAWVSCQEKVSSAVDGEFMSAVLHSTNIFGRVRGR